MRSIESWAKMHLKHCETKTETEKKFCFKKRDKSACGHDKNSGISELGFLL
jgi:2-hydroxy-3-keto-5-methylthiopentenyl-1-phosphate phosphatase